MITEPRKCRLSASTRTGITIVEVLVLIAIIGIVIGMMLPAVRRVREASPRVMCMNNLRQIALATLNYESAYMQFPAGTGIENLSSTDSGSQLSALVAILPFLDQSELYNQITNPREFNGISFPACPRLHAQDYTPWRTSVSVFQCPSLSVPEVGIAPTHYGFCIGDRARNIASPKSYRGAFASSLPVSFGIVTDGLSNTILAGEIGSNREGAIKSPFAINQDSSLLDNPQKCWTLVDESKQGWEFGEAVQLSVIGRGGHWADGRAGVAFFNTILPPGSPSVATQGSVGADGIYSASGPHSEFVAVALMDGSTHVISKSIDAGYSSSPTLTEPEMLNGVSTPYGVWGALGTIGGGEVAEFESF